MANPFDIAEGKVNPFDVAESTAKANPFDIAEKQMNPFDVAEASVELPSQKVFDVQGLTGTPVAPGMPANVASGSPVGLGGAIKDIAIGTVEAPVKLASDVGQFALEGTTPFKYLENMLFGDDSETAFKSAQQHTRNQQALINYQPVSKMGTQLPAVPFLPVMGAMAGVDKVLDVAGGEGTPDASGAIPVRKQAAEGIKQGILSSLAMLGARSAITPKKPVYSSPKETTNVAEAIKSKSMPKAEEPIVTKGNIMDTPQGDIQAGSLAYGMELPAKRLGIRKERLGGTEYDTQKAFVDLVDVNLKKIMDSKEPISFEKMTKAANDIGYTIDDFVGKGKKPTVHDYAYQKAFADATTASIEALSNAKKKIAESQGSPESLAEFAIALDQASLIVPKYIKAGTEQARGLVARRINGSTENLKSKNFNKIIEAAGGKDKLAAIAEKFKDVDLSNQYQVNKFIKDVTKVKKADQVYWVWLNSILSGPATHVANIVSNTLTGMTKPVEKGVAASIDVLRSLAPGSKREVFFGEVPHDVYGAIRGLGEGVRAATKAWKDDMPQLAGDKFEVSPTPIKGLPGRIIGGPTRALMAADEFFKAIVFRSEINSIAYRQATTEGLKGKAKVSRIAELSNNPLDWMTERGIKEAKYRTFQKELGEFGTGAINLRNKSQIAKILFPFIKTPTNIVKFGLERTPLEFIDLGIRAAKGEYKGGAISEQMAKPILGTLVSGALISAMNKDTLSGSGPTNKNERDALYRTGWQPYSIKYNGKWYSYKRIEPLGMIVGMTADAKELWPMMTSEEKAGFANALSISIGQNILNKTWMQGANNALNAITDPERYGNSWAGSLVGSLVPGVVAATARAVDPHMRKADSILEQVKTRVPGMSKEVLPKLNLWGEPISKSEGVFENTVGKFKSRLLSPIPVSPERNSKIDNEIVRLINTGYMQPPGPPSKTLNGIELTPKQHQELQSRGGKLAKAELKRIVQTKEYDAMNNVGKTKTIEKVIDEFRSVAAAEMLGKINNELGSDVVRQGMQRTQGLIPRNTKPSPDKSLHNLLLGIGGRK